MGDFACNGSEYRGTGIQMKNCCRFKSVIRIIVTITQCYKLNSFYVNIFFTIVIVN